MLFMNTLIFWFGIILTSCSISDVPVSLPSYSSQLTTNHSTYNRNSHTKALHYFEAIEVIVTMNGTFNFTSVTINKKDIYGYLYKKSFDPSNSSLNVYSFDDDSGNDLEFHLKVFLEAGKTYVLVVTTYSQSVTLSFTINVSGPGGTISFKRLNVTSSSSTTTVTPMCNTTIIKLSPDTKSEKTPVQFRKFEGFYIKTNIMVRCTTPQGFSVDWTIYSCNESCSTPIEANRLVTNRFGQLYIPPGALNYGTYQFKLTVSIDALPTMDSSESTYVGITPSNIMANLVLYGTSVITSGDRKDLVFNPGNYSVESDSTIFNASDWTYKYYCLLYDLYDAIKVGKEHEIGSLQHPCFLNSTVFPYAVFTSMNSTVTILAGSLTSNQTYQFRVFMTNRRQSSLLANGYVIVNVQKAAPNLIAVVCIISTMCSSNSEFQLVNPSTQVALFSMCVDDCPKPIKVTWDIYRGSIKSSTDTVKWTPLSGIQFPYDPRFFGMNTSSFTATNNLFEEDNETMYWRFEAVYTFVEGNSSSALNFQINQPPKNGSCRINPLNGTTNTIFTINCSLWADENGIQDYSFYTWTTDMARRVMLASTKDSFYDLRLPAGSGNTSSINIIVQIRDKLNSIARFDLRSITVKRNTIELDTLINHLETTSKTLNMTNPIMELLASDDQNVVEQTLTSVSQLINTKSSQMVADAISSGVPAASVSISPLGSTSRPSSGPKNVSALNNYYQQLNKQANAREYFLIVSTNLFLIDDDSIQIQASTLSELTEATNQLTRNASILASAKCYDLARELHSIARKIPREDVELAATHITQCATNVLTAVNGPLQERGKVLDIDFNRSNTVPDDYDTDLESEWANEYLFANGDDFSLETIQKGRNMYYQKEAANSIAQQVNETFSLISAALNIHLNVGQNTTINTSSVFVSMETLSMAALSNKTIEQVGGAQIHIPLNFNLTVDDSEKIYVRSIMQPLASSGNSSSSANTKLSTTISLSLLDKHGNDLLINTSMDEPIKFIIPRDPNTIDSSVDWQYVSPGNGTNQSSNTHSVNIVRNNNLNISVHFEIHPINKSLAYWFIYKFDNAPQVNSSISIIDGWTLLCPSNLTVDNFYRYYIDNQRTYNHQSIVFRLRELNETEALQYCPYMLMNSSLPIIFSEPFNFSSDYKLRTYTSGCYYLDTNNNWQSDGLLVGPSTNLHQTECFSTHLTTFAGGFFPIPVNVNWNFVFSNADFIKNKTIYLTIITVCICYIILIIFARYRDRKDIENLGITFLPDNCKSDQYFYQIIVFTGNRKDAGTESKVHFVLGGDNDETSIRTLAHPNRKILQRSGIDAFIMAVPKYLGLLNYLRIWHDNTGRGVSASWFLKYIIVRDLQKMIKTHFICQRWFAVEKDDGMIERLIPVAGEYQKQQLAYILSKQAYHSMSEGHLWFSIFSRPPSSKFTRIQRCTCCFVLLLTAMIFNILYYEHTEASKTKTDKNGLSLGPFYFSREEIGVGILIELFCFLPSLLLVQLFRRIRQRNISENKQKQMKLTFPWWCIFLAYILSILSAGLSIFFIIIHGIDLGDLRTQKWLTSVVIGFFSSVCVTQPLKVLCLAIIFAVFIRNLKDDDDEMTEHIDSTDHSDLIDRKKQTPSNQDKTSSIGHSQTQTNRLTKYEVEEARSLRVQKIKMWSIIREILSYVCFLYIVFAVSYSTRNPNAFIQANHLRKFFLNIGQSQYDYTKIVSINEYWDWLNASFISNIRGQKLYNGERTYGLKGFINDTSNRFIGWATMRQLRVKSESCKTQSSILRLNMTCEGDYSFLNEEQRSFQPGWTDEPTTDESLSIHKSFIYRTSKQIDTYVYMGNHETYGSGGYVYEFRGRISDLRSNISKLHQLGWIDDKTRAVIIQCTLYNPNVQLFTSVTLLIELLPTGGIIPTARFEPLNFQISMSLFDLINSILYIVFIIYFMVIEIQSLTHRKFAYFRQFWSYINWGIIGCSWAAVGTYAWRYQEMERIGDLFRKHKGYVYINLQLATYVHDVHTFLLGFCCFFGTIKLLRFCRYHQRLSIFVDTFRYVWKDLLAFTTTFSIVFMAFLVLFYLLFASNIWACSSLLQTAAMLFEAILFKFDAKELHGANRYLGPICFFLFIFFVVFIGMTMFISIVSGSFRKVRKLTQTTYNEDHDMLEFIWDKFLRWTGLRKPDELELQEERDKRMRSEYHDPIERFSEKFEQFLEATNRIKILEQTELSKEEQTTVTSTPRRRCSVKT